MALKKIKANAFSRGFSLAKVSASAGVRAASHVARGLFSSEEESAARFKDLLLSQIDLLTRELGELKGSMMKVGQMLSVYGEYFLPPEANAVLKSLQNQSPPLAWPAIEKVLKRQLGAEKLSLLEIDREPVASASLGQVHRARRKSDGKELALKVQYPGVDHAIDSDLRALRAFLSISKIISGGRKLDEIFREVKTMLHQEVDYRKELEATDFFRAALDPARYIVPETIPEFSTGRILATSFEEGLAVDSPEVLALSQERRNALGTAALELYFREMYEFNRVQTDPHFGNYRVRGDRLVLLDFGAVRKVPATFLEPHKIMLRGALDRDPEMLLRGSEQMGFIHAGDPPELRQTFVEICFLITEPFVSKDVYDWGASDLPKRVAKRAARLVFSFRTRVPPREVVFLDRKMGGVFIFMKVLGVKIRCRELLEKYL
jgi:predicted unusual protein kinase regulating ubiquinone biosynthesis (AarF/ABC1/UbiB family)